MNGRKKITSQSLGEAVRTQRKSFSMNQATLAMVSGTGIRFISDLENGKESCEIGKTLQVLQNLGFTLTITPPERR
jgi:y4mF family transcriptional regulator